jgi:serine/threonine-protein kinase
MVSASDRGRRIGNKYELVAPVGEGGMASVWRGLTLGAAGFSRKVAIKRVLPELAHDSKFAAMFVEEARVVADLAHPNIVQVHDFDHDDRGNYFIVMEWVEGLDLEKWIRAHRKSGHATPWAECASIAVGVLEGLGAAHERVDDLGRPAPVIHRDVTPTNILIAKNGIVKLADFGLAKAMDRASMTKPGTVKGKLAYMAPEILAGRPASVLSDLFGVGIVLWESLARARLYDGKTDVDVVLKAKEAKVPRIDELRPDIPLTLAEAVHTALAREPAERFETAREMRQTIASVLRSEPVPTGPDPLAESVRSAFQWLGKT